MSGANFRVLAKDAVARSKEESQQEQTGLHQHNAAGCGAIAPVADDHAQQAGDHAAGNGQQGHAIKAVGE